MSEPFLAEIRIVGFNFPPRGWAFCNGQLLPIAQNTALFSLLGTIYGGNGTTNFALPNLQGRAPMHPGSGPGLTPRSLGEEVGETSVTLTQAEMPSHNHTVNGNAGQGAFASPAGQLYGVEQAGGGGGSQQVYTDNLTTLVQYNPQAVGPAGGSQPHDNMQPYLGVNFVIAMQGIFPSRN